MAPPRAVHRALMRLCTRSGAITMPLYISTDAAYFAGKWSANGTVDRDVAERYVGIMDFYRRDMVKGPNGHNSFEWYISV